MPYEFDRVPDQLVLPTQLTEGGVATIRVTEGDATIDTPLYLRSHLMDKAEVFHWFVSDENERKRELYVSGPPGCGKTLFMNLCGHMYAANQSKRVLIINFRENSACNIVTVHGSETKRLRMDNLVASKLFEVVQGFLNETIDPFDLCIFDGVRYKAQRCRDVLGLLNVATGKGKKIEKVIHVTSMEFVMPLGDKPQGFKGRVTRVNFDSWTEKDYISALTNKEFLQRLPREILEEIQQWNQPKEGDEMEIETKEGDDKEMNAKEGKNNQMGQDRCSSDDLAIQVDVDTILEKETINEYVAHKFFYAGGSARLMFDFLLKGAKEALDILVRQVPLQDWEAFTTTSLPSSAANAVNSLMQQFLNQTTAVSKYILFVAYSHVEGRLIQAVQSVANATGNPSLKGWAFELQQLEVIKKVLKHSDTDLGSKFVKTKEGLVFQPVSKAEVHYDGNTIVSASPDAPPLDHGTVIWCLKWNQGCFDVAYFKFGTLLTFQFTVSDDHSLKLQYIRGLKEKIDEVSTSKVETIFHFGIVEKGKVDIFGFKNPEGAGRSCWAKDFVVTIGTSSELYASPSGPENFSIPGSYEIQVYTTKKRKMDD